MVLIWKGCQPRSLVSVVDGRKHGHSQEVSFVQAQVIEKVHGSHPPASLKLAMFSLLPYLEESSRHDSRVCYLRQKPSSKFISSSTVCPHRFHFSPPVCSKLSTFASMKSGNSPIAIARKVRHNSCARTPTSNQGNVGGLVWKASQTRLSETYIHSS